MRAAGLEPPPLARWRFDGKAFRWQPEGKTVGRKSAWAKLYEGKTKAGRDFIYGAFGNKSVWWPIEQQGKEWTTQERADFVKQRAENEKKFKEDRAVAAEAAASKAQRLWERGRTEGASAYLMRKKVGAHGLRFMFGTRIAVPMRDVRDKLWGLQWIGDDGGKVFGTDTLKEGRFHLIGSLAADTPLLAFAEGYATAATVYEASGWPVVVCFDAGNLEPVMRQWRELYPEMRFVVAADDDRHLLPRLCERLAKLGLSMQPQELARLGTHSFELPDGRVIGLAAGWKKDTAGTFYIDGTLTVDGAEQPLRLENAGMAKAALCAKKHKALVLAPVFAAKDGPGTDWNDLHCAEGLQIARKQLFEGLDAPKKNANDLAQREGDGADSVGVMGLLKRYTLLYGTTTVWDAEQHKVVRLEALGTAFRDLVPRWLDHPRRAMVPSENLVFDPTQTCEPGTHINMFERLPLMPDISKPHELLVNHLYFLCGENDGLFDWVCKWLALPLQRVGAKMRTALILHGAREGTGKSYLMQVMRAIYGKHGRAVTQLQLQSEFTDWLSQMLFCVAEEVVSSAERKHHKGLLKNLITNDTIPINEKQMPIRWEKNHANFVFLSNEHLPVQLDEFDRRFTVLKIERLQNEAYFKALTEEVNAGGTEGFYAWLLQYPLGDFNEFSRPFETKDRLRLITMGLSPDRRFISFWRLGLAELPYCTCRASDLYTAFQAWCRVNGERFIPNSTVFGNSVSNELKKVRKRIQIYPDKCVTTNDFAGSDEVGYARKQCTLVLVPLPERAIQDAPSGDGVKIGAEAGEIDGAATALIADLAEEEKYSADARRFQRELAELIQSARRSI
jgi:putative DNA primase/helicase